MSISTVLRMTLSGVAAILLLAASAQASDSCIGESITSPQADGIVQGTSCSDLIIVAAGVSQVKSGDGNDVIVGGTEVNSIAAGEGDDIVYANGDAEVDAGGGDDLVFGDGELYDSSVPSATSSSASNRRLQKNALRSTLRKLRKQARFDARHARSSRAATVSADIYGNENDNTIFGGGGNDQIYGLAGADTLYGDSGDDAVYGGTGNDMVTGGHGVDIVQGQDQNDYVRGDGGEDELTGGSGNGDTVSYATGITPGFSPNDTDIPNAVHTFLASIAGFPSVAEGRGVYIDLSNGSVNVARNGTPKDAGGDDDKGTIDGFENIIGTPYADYIIGNSLDNEIHGGGGADVIRGVGGIDEIYGGASGDNLAGGTEADTIHGGPGVDYCDGENTSDSCNESGSAANKVIGRDTSKIAIGFQTDFSSTLPYRELYVTGGSSIDKVEVWYTDVVGAPDEVYFENKGSTPFDTSSAEKTDGCDYSEASSSAPFVWCTFAKPLDAVTASGSGNGDTLKFVDSGFMRITSPMILGGAGGDNLTGTSFTDDVLADGDGNDTLSGGSRNDVLINTDGVDSLNSGGDDDLFLSVATCEGDTLNGAGGMDNASWARLPVSEGSNGVEALLSAGGGGNGSFGNFSSSGPYCSGSGSVGTLIDMENLEGSVGLDRLTGNNSDNRLLGHSSKDRLVGGYGDDTLTGQEGGDVFDAGGGSDLIWAYDGVRDTVDCGANANDGNYDKGGLDVLSGSCGGLSGK